MISYSSQSRESIRALPSTSSIFRLVDPGVVVNFETVQADSTLFPSLRLDRRYIEELWANTSPSNPIYASVCAWRQIVQFVSRLQFLSVGIEAANNPSQLVALNEFLTAAEDAEVRLIYLIDKIRSRDPWNLLIQDELLRIADNLAKIYHGIAKALSGATDAPSRRVLKYVTDASLETDKLRRQRGRRRKRAAFGRSSFILQQSAPE